MMKNNLKVFLIVSIGLIAIVSGCVGGQDVTSAFKALPEVQQFMKEHPNAKITVTYWSKDEVTQSTQEISQQCEKPITPIAMYKATISEGELKVVSWINAENQIVVCSTTQGSGGSQIINPTPNPTQTYISTAVPTASITLQNNADTGAYDLKIQHRGGDTLKGGDWKISVVTIGTSPVFSISQIGSDLAFGAQINVTSTTVGSTVVNNTIVSGGTALSSGQKYDVKLIHIPSNAMLLDSVVEVR